MTVPQIAEIVLCVLFAAVGYLLGSIPFGLIVTRLTGARASLAAPLLDGAKAGVACLIGWGATEYLIQNHVPLGFRVDLWNTTLLVGVVGGVAAVLGHRFPLWLRFRGGSVVAPLVGLAVAMGWILLAG